MKTTENTEMTLVEKLIKENNRNMTITRSNYLCQLNLCDDNDMIIGSNTNDQLVGGKGNDTIIGKDGADSILGGEGADILLGGDHKDFIVGNAGNDYISGGADNDFLFGGNGNDLIFGGDGDDLIESDNEEYLDNPINKTNIGNDHVFAGEGDDTIVSGRGNDFLDGGKGDDTYRFYFGDGANIINEVAENNNTLVLYEHFLSNLSFSRHGSHMLITSKLKGDDLRILVKDQLSQDGPRINWLETKALPGNGPANLRIKIPNIFAERTQDLGEIEDYDISFMLRHETAYGVIKVSSIFTPKMATFNTENDLAMLTEMISMQEGQTLESHSGHRFIPKNAVNFIHSLAQP
ncbi:calcium-binding protein [Yersinia massiliensis]|uniref:calcium-binding protein n=1 Tax=Yersinia massiliensis TaxID=419257 RepID=UPI0011A90861|nr:calcium-binding protein [Yersinia massiliensis]